MPKDEREREILDKLTVIQDKLLLLKRDRTNYIRTQDVMELQDQFVEQVRQVNDIRKGEHKGENRCMPNQVVRAGHHQLTLIAVDKVLESCLQHISLFFMTIGRTSEVPAAYALTSTIKRLLDHLTEARLFSSKDLTSISNTLGRIESILEKRDSTHSPYLIELLGHRKALCKSMLANLQMQLDQLGEPLQAIYEQLISVMRSMSLANTKSKVRAKATLRGNWR